MKADTSRAAPYAALGDAYLQKARETADPAFYSRADLALRTALQRDPRDAGALTAMGSLANARHDFRAGLRYGIARGGRGARRRASLCGVIVDAQVELGRYDAAEHTLQRMVDLKPNLSSYARVSYFRELHGDLPGAIAAMRLAASAGGDAGENLAYVQTLLGNLELARGNAARRERAYRLALARYSGYVAAAGRPGAREREPRGAGRGDPPLPQGGHPLPMPEYVVGLAERGARGRAQGGGARGLRAGAGAAAPAAPRGRQRRRRHGGRSRPTTAAPARAVELGRRGYAAAPSVRSADALGLGADARRPRRGGPWLCAARAAARLARRDMALPRRDRGPRRRAAGSPRAAI